MAAEAPPLPAYARLATLVLRSPVVVDAVVRSAKLLRGADAAGVAPGYARFYVTLDMRALIRSGEMLPARVTTLVDAPLDARGRPPKLKKQRLLLFARAVPGRPGELQLVGSDAHFGWSPELDAAVRGIVREVVSPDAPPEITGVGNVFHVPGSLPGEGETQVFLQTRDARPVSLTVLRRPGETPRWAVALAEIVDDSAAPPARDTLLWYRLACFLPPQLPEASLADADPADAERARADYRFVLESLGPCRRD